MDARISRLAIRLVLCLSLAGCAAEEIGTEYGTISEAESGILFYGPGLERGYRQFLAGQTSTFVDQTFATYGPPTGEFPRSEIVLIEAPPNRHIARLPVLKNSIDSFGLFKNRAIVTGPGGHVVNAIGDAEYLAFTADRLSGVIWRQTASAFQDGGYGKVLMFGYYCKGEAPMMTGDEAGSILTRVGHVTYGSIDPPAGWPAR